MGGPPTMHDMPPTVCHRELGLPLPESRILNPESCSFPTYHLRHTIYPLCFQQHSRYQRVTTLVFYNIPGPPPLFPQRSFVFIDIPA
jgi:hypothetical protein